MDVLFLIHLDDPQTEIFYQIETLGKTPSTNDEGDNVNLEDAYREMWQRAYLFSVRRPKKIDIICTCKRAVRTPVYFHFIKGGKPIIGRVFGIDEEESIGFVKMAFQTETDIWIRSYTVDEEMKLRSEIRAGKAGGCLIAVFVAVILFVVMTH